MDVFKVFVACFPFYVLKKKVMNKPFRICSCKFHFHRHFKRVVLTVESLIEVLNQRLQLKKVDYRTHDCLSVKALQSNSMVSSFIVEQTSALFQKSALYTHTKTKFSTWRCRCLFFWANVHHKVCSLFSKQKRERNLL